MYHYWRFWFSSHIFGLKQLLLNSTACFWIFSTLGNRNSLIRLIDAHFRPHIMIIKFPKTRKEILLSPSDNGIKWIADHKLRADSGFWLPCRLDVGISQVLIFCLLMMISSFIGVSLSILFQLRFLLEWVPNTYLHPWYFFKSQFCTCVCVYIYISVMASHIQHLQIHGFLYGIFMAQSSS